jgi:carboxyl-terminal processing protease
MDKVRRSDRFEMYVNSLTNVFDPHSDYFNAKEKEDFDINMSGRLEGIGARSKWMVISQKW